MRRFLVLLLGVVSAAFFATPALATEGTPSMGWIEICKASHGNPTLVDTFSFKLYVNGSQYTPDGVSSISAPVGACTAALPVPAGEVTVVEQPTYTSDGHGGQFSSFDYTDVTAIHTSAPGAQDAQLVSADLGDRSATVVVNPSQYSTDETLVTFTNDPVQGYIEVCKTQTEGAGLDSQSFPFTVSGGNGFTWSGSITTAACSDPILAPSGHVIVQETGTQYVAGITSPNSALEVRSGQTSTAVVDPMQVASGWVSVNVAPNGTVSGESIVSFEDNTSQLKICKVASSPSLVGETFHFTVNGAGVDVVADAPGSTGHCILVGAFPAGTAMLVTEAPTPGVTVDHIALSDGRPFVQGGSDFVGVSAAFTLGAGVETITYYDATDPGGMLKVCKHGPAGEPAATFTVAGPRGVAPDTIPGIDTLVVPVNECVFVPMPVLPYAGMQVITEMPLAGYSVASASVADAYLQASALTGNSIGAYVGSGITTVVTFTNVAAAVVPPTTSTETAAPAASGGSSGGSSSGGSAPADPPASTPAPVQPQTAVTAPAVVKTKAILKSSLASSRIVNHRVIVRIVGSAQKATIRVTLYNAKHKVLRSVLRSVKTNRAVTVPNLKLGPAVKHFKVKVL